MRGRRHGNDGGIDTIQIVEHRTAEFRGGRARAFMIEIENTCQRYARYARGAQVIAPHVARTDNGELQCPTRHVTP